MNKKVIKILSFAFISFFTSIFIVGNAKAETIVNVDYDGEFVQSKINENIELLNFIENTLVPYSKTINQRYSIVINSSSITFILYENATDTQLRSYWYGGANNKIEGKPDNTSIKYLNLYLSDLDNYTNESVISSLENKNYINSMYWNYFGAGGGFYGSSKPNITFDLYDYTFNNYDKDMYSAKIIYDTNLDYIKVISTDSNYFLPISFNNENVAYENDYFLTYKQVMDVKPKITFTKTENTENGHITSVDVNVKFSSIDNDKYVYQYKRNDLEGWVTYNFNDTDNFTLNYEKNDILYVRVLDKNTFEEITISTYNISSLIPYLVLKHDDNSDCYVDNKQVCDNIRVYPNLMTYDKYMFYYSEDGGTTWLTSYSAFTKTVTESNKTYLFKITDLEGNIIDNLSYTQSPFGEFDTSYPYVKFEYKIDKNLLVYYLDTYLYNYDTSKYKFYYSENGKDFYELLQNKYVANYNDVYLKTYNPFIQMFSLKFTKNSYVYIKITDLEGNSLGTYTHFIDYDKALEELDNSWFKPIKEFIDNNIFNKLPIIQQLIDIYNSFQYVEGKDEPPVFDFDLGFIGLGNVTIKMDFFNEYRQTFFDYMKIFFSITTVFAVLTELKDVIGGGD